MNRSSWSRAALASLIVLLPIVMLSYYQSELRYTLGLPGVWAVLTRPLAAPVSTEAEKVEEQVEESVVLRSVKIAAGRQLIEPSKEVAKEETENTVAEEEAPPQDDSTGKAEQSEVASIDIATLETVENLDLSENEEKVEHVDLPQESMELHAGTEKEGILLPALNLKVGEKELAYLLQKELAFIVVTVAGQRYLLTVTDQENPYRNVNVGHLRDQQDLSNRYLPLPRTRLQGADLDALDNQVINRTGHQAEPSYSLVFSNWYNDYLTGVQLAKVKQMGLDLAVLRSSKTPVSMQGRLLQVGGAIELVLSPLKIGLIPETK